MQPYYADIDHMETKPLLEDFRKEDLGQTKIAIYKDGVSDPLLMYYYDSFLFDSAMNLTFSLLNDFHTKYPMYSPVTATFALWSLSIESYINTILKCHCFTVKNDFEKNIKPKDLKTRFNCLFSVCEKDPSKKQDHEKKIVNAKLDDFQRFRNDLFHARYLYKKTEKPFNETKFSSNVHQINFIDILQSLNIAMEVFTFFRYALPGHDLMPQVVIRKDDGFVYKKFDTAYNEIILPTFKEILIKKELQSQIDTKIESSPLGKMKNISSYKFYMIMQAHPEQALPEKHISSNIILQKYMEKVTHEDWANISPGTFRTPDHRDMRDLC